VRREINLNGGEISLLKSIGVSGTPIYGKLLLSRLGEIDEREFLDTITGLIDQDYIISSRVNVTKIEDVERSFFRVNSIHVKELREAMRPGGRREDERDRRRRRS
jgi:hypothetical protein